MLNFSNLSYNGNGTEIISYQWDFGNGEYSNETNPVFSYNELGQFVVTLVVTNSCGCISTSSQIVNVNSNNSYQIECPTVVCENSIETYYVSFDAMEDCSVFNWEVEGGTIIEEVNGIIQVEWNNVNESGFGYITFDASNCNVECPKPTMVKVPVVKAQGERRNKWIA